MYVIEESEHLKYQEGALVFFRPTGMDFTYGKLVPEMLQLLFIPSHLYCCISVMYQFVCEVTHSTQTSLFFR